MMSASLVVLTLVVGLQILIGYIICLIGNDEAPRRKSKGYRLTE
jgi:hypothetical protein